MVRTAHSALGAAFPIGHAPRDNLAPGLWCSRVPWSVPVSSTRLAPPVSWDSLGADDGIRTRDPNLGDVKEAILTRAYMRLPWSIDMGGWPRTTPNYLGRAMDARMKGADIANGVANPI